MIIDMKFVIEMFVLYGVLKQDHRSIKFTPLRCYFREKKYQ